MAVLYYITKSIPLTDFLQYSIISWALVSSSPTWSFSKQDFFGSGPSSSFLTRFRALWVRLLMLAVNETQFPLFSNNTLSSTSGEAYLKVGCLEVM